MLAGVYFSLKTLGIDTSGMTPPERKTTLVDFFGTVLLAPLIETLLLSLLLTVLLRLTDRTLFAATVSGVLWGAFHATLGLLWFFGTAWSFFVLSCAYLGWRQRSFQQAFIAAAAPHALINLSAMVVLALERSA